MRPRLLIVTSHPIQYQAPWFRALDEDPRIQLEVLFLTIPDAQDQGVGFGKSFEWDVPLLDGYDWRVAESAVGGISKGYFGLRVSHARRDLLKNSPDAILLTGWQHFGMLQCLRAAVRSGKPVLVRAESNGLKPLGTLQRIKAKLGLRGIERFLPIGESNDLFYRKIGLQERVGERVPYFVDNKYFKNKVLGLIGQRQSLRQKFDIPAEAVCFIFVGKFVEKKHPMHALEALREVVSGSPGGVVHLLMVGSGELEAVSKQFALDNAFPVSFTGFLNQSEIPAAYAAADCILLPSDYGETWGLVVNEAMACGLPAIVSDRCGCSVDLVHEGNTGFRFQFGETDDLALVMRRFLSLSLDDRASMGQNAEKLITEKYSVELATENTISEVSRAVEVQV